MMELVQALMAIVQALVDLAVILAYCIWAAIALCVLGLITLITCLVRKKFPGRRFARRV